MRGCAPTTGGTESGGFESAMRIAGGHAVDKTAPDAVAGLEALLRAALDAVVEGLVERGVLGPPSALGATAPSLEPLGLEGPPD